jgi:macrodomain Ter protein organizer (MatP/YcbG family)
MQKPCVEELHREVKQLTGIQNCQCRKQRIQRNHIACAFLVWARLKSLAYKTGQTVYQLKQNLLDDYMRQQLRSPAISMGLA